MNEILHLKFHRVSQCLRNISILQFMNASPIAKQRCSRQGNGREIEDNAGHRKKRAALGKASQSRVAHSRQAQGWAVPDNSGQGRASQGSAMQGNGGQRKQLIEPFFRPTNDPSIYLAIYHPSNV